MTVVTDNASNMTKAFDFSLPGYTTDKDDESDSDDEDLADPSEDATSSEGPLTEYLQTHSRCYAHSLQLVVKDGLKDASQLLKNVIAKATYVVHFRNLLKLKICARMFSSLLLLLS